MLLPGLPWCSRGSALRTRAIPSWSRLRNPADDDGQNDGWEHSEDADLPHGRVLELV